MKKDKGYDFIFSIGSACHCSSLLRKTGLQKKSYPFDWVAYCNFENRADLIVSNFKNFFNKEDLEKSNKFNDNRYINKQTNGNAFHT